MLTLQISASTAKTASCKAKSHPFPSILNLNDIPLGSVREQIKDSNWAPRAKRCTGLRPLGGFPLLALNTRIETMNDSGQITQTLLACYFLW